MNYYKKDLENLMGINLTVQILFKINSLLKNTWGEIIIFIIKKVAPEMPLHGRYPEPDEFKVEVTHTYWVSYSG